eukprot:TRINITY_DN8194_c0_g2_i5.p1 TRINITY_DN8194_c0_g2~~TRINITY_DN8194_c0_g2_i5.p1  ORF type:complete len:362 (+),score=53.93 TRINITY_DN8194_c0_g2_i5:1753-2838(+)
MPSRFLFTFTIVLLSLQQLVQIGISGSEFVPLPRKVFVSLLWFLFDFNFVRPGCDTPTYTFPQFYLITLLIIAFCALALVGCSMLRAVLLFIFSRQKRGSFEYYFSKFMQRMSEALTMLGYLVYIMVSTRTLQLIDCKQVYQTDVMRVELARECYVDEHLTAAIVGWIVFFVYVLGYPVYSYYLLRKRMRARTEADRHSKTILKTADFLMDDIKPTTFWFRGVELMVSFVICVFSVLVHNIPLRLMLNGSLTLLKYGLVIMFWPMISRLGNFGSALISSAKVLQSILLLSYYESSGGIGFLVSLSVLLGILVAATFVFFKKRASFSSEDEKLVFEKQLESFYLSPPDVVTLNHGNTMTDII